MAGNKRVVAVLGPTEAMAITDSAVPKASHHDAGRNAHSLDEDPDLLQIAQVAYDAGEMDLVQLLDAAEALWDARTAQARLKADLWTAYYDLERAAGGFDSASGPRTTSTGIGR